MYNIFSRSFRTSVSKRENPAIPAKCSKTDEQQKNKLFDIKIDRRQLFCSRLSRIIHFSLFYFHLLESLHFQEDRKWNNTIVLVEDSKPCWETQLSAIILLKKSCFVIEKPKAEFKDREMTMIFIYNFNSGYVISYTITYTLAIQAI